MYQPEQQQIEIYLMKNNLQEITEDVIVQNSAIPSLEAENKKKHDETISILQLVHTKKSDVEKLKEKNVRLTAKRVQLKQQGDELSSNVESALFNRDELAKALDQYEAEANRIIRKYEDSLKEKADRFRRTRRYYDTEEVREEQEKVDNEIAELSNKLGEIQDGLNALIQQSEDVCAEIDENVLEIFGKPELDEKIRLLTEQFNKSLSAKLNSP